MIKSSIWLCEFFTKENDEFAITFENQPSEEDVELYIGSNDWLLEEMEEGTLEWIVSPILLIKNRSSSSKDESGSE